MQRTGVRPSLLNLSNDARTERKSMTRGNPLYHRPPGCPNRCCCLRYYANCLTRFSH